MKQKKYSEKEIREKWLGRDVYVVWKDAGMRYDVNLWEALDLGLYINCTRGTLSGVGESSRGDSVVCILHEETLNGHDKDYTILIREDILDIKLPPKKP